MMVVQVLRRLCLRGVVKKLVAWAKCCEMQKQKLRLESSSLLTVA